MIPRSALTLPIAVVLLGLALGAVIPAAAESAPQALAQAPAPLVGAAVLQQPASRVLIDSPGPGTLVGSPVTITGSIDRLPPSASLGYVVLAGDGRRIGEGSFPIPGNPGQPALFLASLTFQEPLEGDAITLQLIDLDTSPGAPVATLPLATAALPQRIRIDTPPAGTQVGNPVVLTGGTVRFPQSGGLGYAIYDRSGAQIGGGFFPVAGSLQTGGSFAASLSFTYPPLGGPIRVDLYDQNLSGGFEATASVELQTVALVQQVTITTPPFGTQVGTPMVITGRTSLFPSAGVLVYRVTNAQGAVLGTGSFGVQPADANASTFSASLSFQPPAAPGLLRVQVSDVDLSGRIVATAFVDVRWGP